MLQLPGVSRNRIKLEPSGYLKAGLAAVVLLAAITLYVLQFDHFDKMLNVRYFLLLSIGIGLVLGFLLGKGYADEEHDIVERMRLYMICGGICVVFMPLVICLANRYLDFRTPRTEQAQLLQRKGKTDQPFGYLKGETMEITHYESALLIGSDIYKISTKEDPFPRHAEGDVVPIPIHQGLLGINYLNL